MGAEPVDDEHLSPVLRKATDDDLEPLVRYVKHRHTTTFGRATKSSLYANPHDRLVDDIVFEVRTFGGNSLLNPLRPNGVPYAEVVGDVASKLKVKGEKGASVEDQEIGILLKILDDSVKKMSPAEREALEEEFRKAGVKNASFAAGAPIAAVLAQAGVQLTGFMAYRIAVVVANAVAKAVLGRGLSLVGNAALVKVLGVLAGPVGWAVSGLWTAAGLAGPAYRVTIPVVCHVAMLRQKQKFADLSDE